MTSTFLGSALALLLAQSAQSVHGARLRNGEAVESLRTPTHQDDKPLRRARTREEAGGKPRALQEDDLSMSMSMQGFDSFGGGGGGSKSSKSIRFEPNSGCIDVPRYPGSDGWTKADAAMFDGGSLDISFAYNLLGDSYTEAILNRDGSISFGSAPRYEAGTWPNYYQGFTKKDYPAMVAPFWADVDDDDVDSCGGGEVWYKQVGNALYITWIKVVYEGSVGIVGALNETKSSLAGEDDDDAAMGPIEDLIATLEETKPESFDGSEPLTNTFQLVITNGNEDLKGIGPKNTCFCYGDMEWYRGDNSGDVEKPLGIYPPASVGINKGDGDEYYLIGSFYSTSDEYKGPNNYLKLSGVNWLDDKGFCFDASNGFNINNLNPKLYVSGFPCQCLDDCDVEECICDIGYLCNGDSKTIDLTIHCDDDQDSLNIFGGYDDKDGRQTIEDLCRPHHETDADIDLSFVLNRPGNYLFTAFAVDAIGGRSMDYRVMMTITNEKPKLRLKSCSGVDAYSVGTSVDLEISCVDERDLSVAIDWGDGTALQTVTVDCKPPHGSHGTNGSRRKRDLQDVAVSPPPPSTTVSHTYASAGIYLVTASASDEWLVPADDVTTLVYIYDEDTGLKVDAKEEFPFSSLAVPGVTFAGTAKFKLKAQYKNCFGSRFLAGLFEFELKNYPLPGFIFVATSLDWLIIDNVGGDDYAVVLKGQGKLNGSGGYYFYVFMQDKAGGKEAVGNDTVRVVILEYCSGPDELVYDNMLGAPIEVIGYEGTALTKGDVKVDGQKGSADTCDLKKDEVGPTPDGEGIAATTDEGDEGLFRRRSLQQAVQYLA